MSPKEPAPHGMQSESEVEPLVREKVPAGHSDGNVMPVDAAYVPGGQGRQALRAPAVG